MRTWLKISNIFQNHYARKHKGQNDVDVRPHHRVGKGPLHVVVEEQLLHQEDDLAPDLDNDLAPEDEEEEERLGEESYKALK